MRKFWDVIRAAAFPATTDIATAQATTAAGATTLPVTPNPAECTVKAPDIDHVLARVHKTPMPGPPLPATPQLGTEEPAPLVATPASFTLPVGQPADAATVAAVISAMRQLLACVNTGNALAIFPLASDNFVRMSLKEEPVTRPEERQDERAGSPPPLPAAEWESLIAVWDVRVLPDRRVGAIVAIHDPDLPPGDVRVDYFEFVPTTPQGHYLLNAVVNNVGQFYPPPGSTPGTPPA